MHSNNAGLKKTQERNKALPWSEHHGNGPQGTDSDILTFNQGTTHLKNNHTMKNGY